MSITINGMYIINPMINALRSSDTIKLGISTRFGIESRVPSHSVLDISINTATSFSWVWGYMNSRIGPIAAFSASAVSSSPASKGTTASLYTFIIVGCMIKNVRNSASPIRTLLGGAVWVLSAILVK